MYDTLQSLLHLVKRKYLWYTHHGPEDWLKFKKYIDEMKGELEEVEEEIIPYNTVYLEDECGDVLWDYLNLLYTLKEEWYISSVERVFTRCLKKYTQRINDKEKWILRDKTKTQQKKQRLEEAKQLWEK